MRIAPARISQQLEAVGRDLYNTQSTTREVLILAAALAPGDSGAALVNGQGAVVGVAFAVAPDRPGTSYALARSELADVLAEFNLDPGRTASTQACVR